MNEQQEGKNTEEPLVRIAEALEKIAEWQEEISDCLYSIKDVLETIENAFGETDQEKLFSRTIDIGRE